MNVTSADRRLRLALAIIVIVHFTVALWHGAAHTHVPVPLTRLQTNFVILVIFLLPLGGLSLLYSPFRLLAAWIITGAMLASLLFGILNHFVLDSPDNIAHIPQHAWRSTFVASAAIVAITEAIGTLLGIVAIKKWRAGSNSART